MIPNHHRNLRATFWESELGAFSHLPIVAWDSDGHPMVANSDEMRLVRADEIPGFDGFALDTDETTRTAY